ncbi:MAG TPA: GDP-L-fucose synthase [Candidatus Methylomirabilis sp.]|nr:GDP-L-fucose synthase [Candidatus Methylomirabilis sp.]
MTPRRRIYVAGGGTLLGAAIIKRLWAQGYPNVLGGPQDEPRLTEAAAVDRFFARWQPDYVFLAAGPSGGIAANQRQPADLMRENLLGACHVIDSAHRHGVVKLLYLASSCSYPRLCAQPMREDALLHGPLEPTNEAYAMAKLAGMVLCKAYAQQHGTHFVTAIPTNAFGPGDDFRPEEGHVIPSLIARFHAAKVEGREVVTVWGTGQPRREFLFADDLADACLFVMREYADTSPINLGGGEDCSIGELAALIAEVVGFPGRIEFDPSRPDGMPLKRLDGSRLQQMGWRPVTPFRDALRTTYRWYLEATRDEALAPLGAGHGPSSLGRFRP